MMGLLERVAAAPISWGVSETADWGHRIAPARLLEELRRAGLRATELGPDGYFLSDSQVAAEFAEGANFSVVAGFVPAVLHEPDRLLDSLVAVDRAAGRLAAVGARVLVLAATGGSGGYDGRPRLDGRQWERLVQAISLVRAIASGHGLQTAFHPHYGSAVADAADIRRLLDSSSIDLCVDSGHLALGGADPVAIAREAPGRVRHVHLKDVDGRLARLLREGELPYSEAVRRGLFRPLGGGEVLIAELIEVLEASGYSGWYVIEQDVSLTTEPELVSAATADIQASVAFLAGVEKRLKEGEAMALGSIVGEISRREP